MVEIIYYTDNRLRHTYLDKLVRQQILKSNLPIISVSLRPMDFGRNIVFEGKRGHSTMFKQVLTGLKASKADYVFLCEHDVLYHPSHFDFIPPEDEMYFYNANVYKYRLADRKVVKYDCDLLSQICANRQLLIQHYEKKLEIIAGGGKAYGYEPGTGQSKIVDKYKAKRFTSRLPNIDIRHGKNWTGVTRMAQDEFRNKNTCQNWQEYKVEEIPGWDTQLLLSINQTIKSY